MLSAVSDISGGRGEEAPLCSLGATGKDNVDEGLCVRVEEEEDDLYRRGEATLEGASSGVEITLEQEDGPSVEGEVRVTTQ